MRPAPRAPSNTAIIPVLSITALAFAACDPKVVFLPTEDAHIRFAAPQDEVIMNVPAGTVQTLELQKQFFRSQNPINLEIARRNDRLELVGMHDSLADGIIENPSWYLTQHIIDDLDPHQTEYSMNTAQDKMGKAAQRHSLDDNVSYLSDGYLQKYSLAPTLWWDTVRVHTRGRCSRFVPWEDASDPSKSIFSTIRRGVSQAFGCGINEASSWLGDPGYGAWQHRWGAFPTFYSSQWNGVHVVAGGFSIFGHYEADFANTVGNSDLWFKASYIFSVDNFVPTLGYRTHSVYAENSVLDGMVVGQFAPALVHDVPNGVTSAIRSGLSLPIPGCVQVSGGGLKAYPGGCDKTAYPAAQQAMCKEKITGMLRSAIVGNLTAAGYTTQQAQVRANQLAADFRNSDFSCEAITKKASDPEWSEDFYSAMCGQSGCTGGAACGQCVFHVPVQAVNTYNDGFELVVREHETYDVFHALEAAIDPNTTDPGAQDQLRDIHLLCNPGDGERSLFHRNFTTILELGEPYFDNTTADCHPPQTVYNTFSCANKP